MEFCCVFCDSKSIVQCQHCEKRFCSPSHHDLHVSLNGQQCYPFDIGQSPKVGRFLVASRDIEPGEIVFQNDPLAAGPNHECMPMCLSCFDIQEPITYQCPDCGYPMCDLSCAQSKSHGTECKILARVKYSSSSSSSFDKENYHLILPLRLLILKQSQPGAFRLLSRLMDHNQERKESDYWTESEVKVVNRLVKAGAGFEPQDIHRVIGILEVNAYEIACSSTGSGFRGTYPISSLLSHSCIPNSTMYFSKESPFRCQCIATVKIKKGEEIFTKYIPNSFATFRRQEKLKVGWFFDCSCQRCKDPTEMESFVGAVKCQGCKDGFYQANPDQLQLWKCSCCQEQQPLAFVKAITDALLDKIRVIVNESRYDAKRFLEVYEDARKKVHPQNEVMIELCQWLLPILCRGHGKVCSDFPTPMLRFKSNLAKEQLQVLNIINPGLNKIRGKVLFELLEPSIYLVIEEFNEGQSSREELITSLANLNQLADEVVLCFGPDFSLTRFESWARNQALVLKEQCLECQHSL